MDFLKNLTLDDKEKQQTEAQAPPVAASATEPAHERSHSGGFLGRFLGGEDKPAEPPAVTVAKPPAEPKRSSFIEKITGNHDEEPPASVAPPPVPEKHQSFIAKLADKFDGDDDPKPPPVPAKEVHESFIGKLFHGKDDAPPAPPPKPEGFLDKVTDAFKGDDSASDKEADLKRREAALKLREEELEKQRKEIGGGGGGFFDSLLHRDSDLPPSKKEMEKAHVLDRLALFNHEEVKEDLGVRSKINAMLGGGKDGEKDEDHLDKAIDLVQQHILKSGDQSHETFLEQMKDEQISDAIRRQYKNMTGHDFPLKDKE